MNESSRAVEEIRISDEDIARRLRFVDFTGADAARVGALSNIVDRHLDEFVTVFFDHLAPFPEAAALLRESVLIEAARGLKAAHLRAMVRGPYGTAYAQERLKLGALYAEAGLDPRLFLGAFHRMMAAIGVHIMDQYAANPRDGFGHFISLKKLGFFDLSLIVDVIVLERERTIREQRERIIDLQQLAIRELSTPVLPVRPGLLLVPMIGLLDTQRARQLMETLLKAVSTHRARAVVLDITGVPIVDSQVAAHLLTTISAARLMGAATILTGVATGVAHALTKAGMTLEGVHVVGDLQRGLEEAERFAAPLQAADANERRASVRQS